MKPPSAKSHNSSVQERQESKAAAHLAKNQAASEVVAQNITGKAVKIETRFLEAKKKADNINVFLNIDSNVGIGEARRRIKQVLNRHPEYTGKIVVSLQGEKIYFWDTSSFR